jgi:hypothetical protein
MELIPRKRMTGTFSPSWRYLTVHTRGHRSFLCPYSLLTARQGNGRVLLFYTPAKGYRHLASDITIRNIIHEADICREAEEQVSRCDKIYGAKSSDRYNSTTTTSRPIEGKAVSGDRGVVCTRVGYLLVFVTA